MRMNFFATLAVVTLALPAAALAQGVINGAEQGAHDGNRAAGPVGGVVGGVVGAVGGGIAGLIGLDQRPRFREYAVRENHQSYVYDKPLSVGVVLPGEGVTYYEVPPEYGVREYRYTIVNGHAVLVDPATRRIVEVID